MSKACIIGWPVAHSRSPLIHGYWLRKYAISGSYDRQPVRPGEVSQFLASMPRPGSCGLQCYPASQGGRLCRSCAQTPRGAGGRRRQYALV